MAASSETPYELIDGNATKKIILEELTVAVAELKAQNVVPGLAVVIVGDRSDSKAYVRMKKVAASKIGLFTIDKDLPDTISQEELIAVVQGLNNDPQVHGILVQLPLPSHIDERLVLKTISAEKDADGFHPLNVGNMWISGGDPPLAIACTPLGCLELLLRYNVTIQGAKCVVLGRSNIVGMPMVALLQSRNGTVTCCHSKTPNIEAICQSADILVVAIGKQQLVKGSWIKKGAVVIDVGMHQIEDSTKKSGFSYVGDVQFDEVAPLCSKITPVPGGVGPMTISMLMKNTINLARHSVQLPPL